LWLRVVDLYWENGCAALQHGQRGGTQKVAGGDKRAHPHPLFPEPIMDAQTIAYLLAAAIKLSGLPAVPAAQLPAFVPLPPAELRAEACKERVAACRGIMALYDMKGHRVLYRDDLDMDSPSDNSFIVHELVHVLQYAQSGERIYQDCPALVRTERAAYTVQNLYLNEQGQLLRVGRMMQMARCAPRPVAAATHTPTGH
jgi:hypothetical protein